MARTDSRPHYGTKRRVRPDGYVDLWRPDHPLARADGYVFEHRAMAWDAGMLTDSAHEVHHRNEDRGDNRLGNFKVLTTTDHHAEHHPPGSTVRNQYGEATVKPPEQRVSAPKPERTCDHCEKAIPPERRRDARFCRDGCRIASWKRARVARSVVGL